MGTAKSVREILFSAELAVLFQRRETAVSVDNVDGSDDTSRAHPLIQAVTQAVTRAVQRRPIIQAQPTRR